VSILKRSSAVEFNQKRVGKIGAGAHHGENEEEQEEEEESEDEEDDEESPLPNLMEHCFYFEQAGIGLSREEMFRIWMALKRLVKAHSFTTIRFWGKIFGLEQNYLVAEGEMEEGEDEEEEEEEAEEVV